MNFFFFKVQPRLGRNTNLSVELLQFKKKIRDWSALGSVVTLADRRRSAQGQIDQSIKQKLRSKVNIIPDHEGSIKTGANYKGSAAEEDLAASQSMKTP